MPPTNPLPATPPSQGVSHPELLKIIKNRFESANLLRKGVCLLNAGRFSHAEAAFRKVEAMGCDHRSLPLYLAACLQGQGMTLAVNQQLSDSVGHNPDDVTASVRLALSHWANNRCDDAIQVLRDGIRHTPENAELHFQLGSILASTDTLEEAELRFTQALSIDSSHTQARVHLALCFAVRRAPVEALAHLQRAHSQDPRDPRIGLLLAQAARAAEEKGLAVRIRAQIPGDLDREDEQGIQELSKLIEQEPDFADAFLSIPVGEVHQQVFVMLLRTLEAALERQPEQAELHYHCGRVLDRLGRADEAIRQNENAVAIDPTFTLALIELGKLYQRTDRTDTALERFENAIATGARYADVYYLLGNLYRDKGRIDKARQSYRKALDLNATYVDALAALEGLTG